MENKILFGNNSDQTENKNNNPKEKIRVKPNLFQGRVEVETKNAAFPDWDIIPPNQFINPRIKSH